MRTSALIVVVSVLLGCNSQLQDPLSNLEGCKIIKAALDEVCKDSEAIDWLNCDYIPGCPGGKVEAESVKRCKNKIAVSPTCQSAKDVECSIDKLNCGPPSETFEKPVGFDTACTKILTVLNAFNDDLCSALQSGECSRFLSDCNAGVYEDDDVAACIDQAKASPDCNSAITALENCEIQTKYCLP